MKTWLGTAGTRGWGVAPVVALCALSLRAFAQHASVPSPVATSAPRVPDIDAGEPLSPEGDAGVPPPVPAETLPTTRSPATVSTDTVPTRQDEVMEANTEGAGELPLEDHPGSGAAELPLEDEPRSALPLAHDQPLDGTPATDLSANDGAALGEFFGHFGFEARLYALAPKTTTQPRYHNTSLSFQPGYVLELGPDVTLRSIGFVRLDENDPKRTHFDAREALLQLRPGALTINLGINKVFWGVTESRHLVDIVNQPDLLESFHTDEKYGQLMAMASVASADLGALDLIVASWFRPQVYPSASGRPGVPILVLDESPTYDAELERWNVDVALRWSHTIGDFDWAVSAFRGNSREPQLMPLVAFVPLPSPVSPFVVPVAALRPHYDLIEQVGIELQWTRGGWQLKAEALGRHGQGPTFAATTAGFEYTWGDALATGTDLGLLLEYNYDGRDNATLNIYDNDVFGAVRISPNDEAGTEVLLGALTDVASGVTSGALEASRRVGRNVTLTVDARLYYATDEMDPLYWFRRDHYVQATIEHYF